MTLKTNKDYRDEAIDQHIGNVEVGNIVACHTHKLTHFLIDIIGDIGVCKLPDGTVNHFPTSELFNVNTVAREAFDNKIKDALVVDRNN